MPALAAARLDIFLTASSILNSRLSRTQGPSTRAKAPKPPARLAVAADVGERPLDQPLDIRIRHAPGDDPGRLAVRFGEQVHQRLRRRRPPELRDLRQRLAGVIGMDAEAVEDDVVGAR